MRTRRSEKTGLPAAPMPMKRRRLFHSHAACFLLYMTIAATVYGEPKSVGVTFGTHAYQTFKTTQEGETHTLSITNAVKTDPNIARSLITAQDKDDGVLWKPARISTAGRKHTYTMTGAALTEPLWVEIEGEFVKPTGGGGVAGVVRPDFNVSVPQVQFKEYDPATDNYGWDDYTMTLSSLVDWPYKSVEVGGTDRVIADVTPNEAYTSVSYESQPESRVTVSPKKAAKDEKIVVTGVAEGGGATIYAKTAGLTITDMRAWAYEKRRKRLSVTLVHEAGGDGDSGYTSTCDISEAAIQAKLQKVFKQAVFEFEVTKLPAKTVSFDNNHDGKLDISQWVDVPGSEMWKIKEACETDHDYNVFLVSRPTDLYVLGKAARDQKFAFVFHSSPTTMAHELGHAHGGLFHELDDTDNIMSYGGSSTWRLRFHQWYDCNHGGGGY